MNKLQKSSIRAFILITSINMLTMTQSFAQVKKQVVRIARVEIDSRQVDNYKAALKEIGETSLREEPGVLMLFSVADIKQPNHITVMEIYADSSAYQAHRETAHFKKYKEATKTMVKSLDLIDADPIFKGIKPAVLQ